jgi:hypothetical protein
MAYKYYSQTSSGWEITTDPKAPDGKQWRATHPVYGERFFDTHDEILPWTCEHMFKQMEQSGLLDMIKRRWGK